MCSVSFFVCVIAICLFFFLFPCLFCRLTVYAGGLNLLTAAFFCSCVCLFHPTDGVPLQVVHLYGVRQW